MPSSFSCHGTIAVEPLGESQDSLWNLPMDDSSLESLLSSLARKPALCDEPEALLFASARWTRPALEPEVVESIRVDLSRLLADLQAEYDHLAGQLRL
jgi:hypothetical protein